MPAPGVAAGNIPPSRFVSPYTGADNKFVVSANADMPIGISQRGTRNTPYSSLDDGYAAIAGESLQIYGATETAMLELGGTVTAGDLLKPDTGGTGKGVTASAGDKYGARTLQSGTSGKLVEVQVQLGELET